MCMRSPQNGCFAIITFAILAGICIASGRSWWICALTIVGIYLAAAAAVWAIHLWREAQVAPRPRPAHLGAQLYEPTSALDEPSRVDLTDRRVF
jgi:cell division protein FtsW (lipid II flippase)